MIIDPVRLALVKKIVDDTNSKIVLSTSWREHWSFDEEKCDEIGHAINDIFAKNGLSIYDKIPSNNRGRENQIEEWLATYSPICNFVVLDDRFLDSEFIRGHFVKTDNYRDGIDEKNVEEAIKILNSN